MKAHLKNQTVEAFHKMSLDVAEGTLAVCGPDGKANAILIGTQTQQECSAKLYAAAPELLAALKSMFLYIETYGGEVSKKFGIGEENGEYYKRLIAKAEGKKP